MDIANIYNTDYLRKLKALADLGLIIRKEAIEYA